MAFATTTSLQTRMISVDFDTATTALAVEMLADAEAEVCKYLSRRYDLSGSTFQTYASVPPLVRTLTLRLGEAYMHKGNSRGGKESLARGVDLEKKVLENLEAIATYKADLTNTLGGLIQDMSNTSYRVLSNTENYQTTFDEDDPLSWAVDADKLDDISSSRD